MRLWLRFFLSFGVLSAFGLLAVVWWQQQAFSSGFRAYLEAAMRARAEQTGELLVADYATHGDWEWLRLDPMQFGRYARDASPAASAAGPGARSPGGNPAGPPLPALRATPDGPPVAALPSIGPPPMEVWGGTRWALHDAEGVYVAGRPGLGADALGIELTLGQTHIGELRIAPPEALAMGAEGDFLRAQWRSALWAVAAILAVSLALAFALARQLSRPIATLGDAARALSEGDYTRRVPQNRRDELGSLAAHFNQMAVALQLHRHERQRWGADIAHELRTPLMILHSELQLLQQGIRPASAAAIDSLIAETDRLSALVEDLYSLALADAGELRCDLVAVELGGWLRKRSRQWRASATAHGLSFDHVDAITPLWVDIDERRFGQALDNLFVNSCRYTDAPGRIELKAWHAADTVHVEWQDSPPGVAEDDLPRLFDRLFRVERSRGRGAGGAGLGLSIVAALVQAQGGGIDAKRSSIGGLCIHLCLPAVAVPT